MKFDAISHREILAQWINDRGYTMIAEIGVKKGNTFLYLLEHCPKITLVGVDIWENKAEKLPEYEMKLRQEVSYRFPDGRGILIKKPSVYSACDFKDSVFDLVFIDADHSEQAVKADILAWRPKVKPTGILCGHDFQMPSVQNAVKEICPRWSLHEQNIWSENTEPLLLTMTPYAMDRNLGHAYNEAMQCLPENAWACLIDHDAIWTTSHWYRQIISAIQEKPEGCFAPMTNRIKCYWQQVQGVNTENHDMGYHREIGRRLLERDRRGEALLQDVTDDARDRTPAGMVMILSKQAWKDAGGFPDGLHYVDRFMWLALKATGRRIYIMTGLYVYHWHRGAGESIQSGPWATRHVLPNGRVLAVKHPEKLPVY